VGIGEEVTVTIAVIQSSIAALFLGLQLLKKGVEINYYLAYVV